MLERIRKLIKFLPKSDLEYAERFIKQRDFISLRDLVVSAIFRVRKRLYKENIKQEYLDVSLSELNRLRAEIEIYLDYLGESLESGDYGDMNGSYIEKY